MAIAPNRLPLSRRLRRPVSVAARRTSPRGQSLVEFCLVLPMLLLILLFGLDFGRVFLGWVELNNVAREAADYAAQNPGAWNTNTPDAAAQAEYRRLVTADASGINCSLPSPIPAPSFPDGSNGAHPIGELVSAQFTCKFQLITPIISNIVGTNGLLSVSASAAFPVTYGTIQGIPVGTAVPTSTPSPSPSVNPSASPSPSPSPSAVPSCIVPTLTGLQTNKAQAPWTAAGFSTSVIFSPLAPPQYNIGSQTTAAGTSELCTSTISVSK